MKAINQNQTEKELFDSFCDRFIRYFSQDMLSFLSAQDLEIFLQKRFAFLQQRNQKELKIEINTKSEFHWHLNKILIDILYDDYYFLVDSLREYFNRQGYEIAMVIHPTFASNRVVNNGDLVSLENGEHLESYIYLELEAKPDMSVEKIKDDIHKVYEEINIAVNDWDQIQKILYHEREVSLSCSAQADKLIEWIFDRNMIVLAASVMTINSKLARKNRIEYSRKYGLFRYKDYAYDLQEMVINVAEIFLQKKKIENEQYFYFQSKIRSRIEKNREMGFLFIRCNHEWLVIAGSFTTKGQNYAIDNIPRVRENYFSFVKNMGVSMGSHSKRMARTIFNYIPIEMKFSLTVNGYSDVYHFLKEVYFHNSRIFKISWYGEHRALLITTFKDEKFSQNTLDEIEKKIRTYIEKVEIHRFIQYDTNITKAYFLIYVTDKKIVSYQKQENAMMAEIKEISQSWEDRLEARVISRYSSNQLQYVLDNIINQGFSKDYIAHTTIDQAMVDIGYLLELPENRLLVCLEKQSEQLQIRIYCMESKLLSDLLPILTDFGLKVKREIYSEIAKGKFHIYIFTIGGQIKVTASKPFAEIIRAVLMGMLPSDKLNSISMHIDTNWLVLSLIKAIAAYTLQSHAAWSKDILNQIILRYPVIMQLASDYIIAVFIEDASKHGLDRKDDTENNDIKDEKHGKDKNQKNPTNKCKDAIKDSILQQMESIFNILDDQIIRQFIGVLFSINRTNLHNMAKRFDKKIDFATQSFYCSFKVLSSQIPLLPEPRPLYEIFVYAAEMEGVHLRGGKVARGGIRWSDRISDFRTEILGLMKTQMVKNAVIVPVGSKGGFVIKKSITDQSKHAEQGRHAYRTMIKGMLDITDNYDQKNQHLSQNVFLDDFDPYLVVAADRGTATFSDLANSISQEYNFWLQDAFASGGSNGYNHKEYGITARGAWESIKRHFFEIGLDWQKQSFSVIGIGDMSGDVFGNGMLFSPNISLLAAFNHQYIFIDPLPDCQKSYEERKRLFYSSNGGWQNYDLKIISKGGGIFGRDDRSIKVSPEIGKLLQTSAEQLSGPELIRLLLMAKVDLFFNGGIGTYIKATDENHQDVGDKTNDSVRINGSEVGAKVIGEGGNLGITQKGRIEIARHGGYLFTDAIDNSGGVDMSDHEVNLKILFADLINNKKIKNIEERNKIQQKIGDEVANHVLLNNYLQALSVSLDYERSKKNIYSFVFMIGFLEKNVNLNIVNESIPNADYIAERQGKGIARPVLSVLCGYSKIYLYNILIKNMDWNDPYVVEVFSELYKRYYPDQLYKKFKTAMLESIFAHKLKNEIISTIAANNFVNILGLTAIGEISVHPQHHARIVQDYYLLNYVVDGLTIRKQLYAAQQELGPLKFNRILLTITDIFVHLLQYLLRNEIVLGASYMQELSVFLNPKNQNTINIRLWVGVFTDDNLLEQNDALGFLQVFLRLQMAVRAKHIWDEMQQTDLHKISIIGLFQTMANLEQEVSLFSMHYYANHLRVKNLWEKDFKLRLLTKLDRYINKVVIETILADNRLDNLKHDNMIRNIYGSEIYDTLLKKSRNQDMELLYAEYLIENSLGRFYNECRL